MWNVCVQFSMGSMAVIQRHAQMLRRTTSQGKPSCFCHRVWDKITRLLPFLQDTSHDRSSGDV